MTEKRDDGSAAFPHVEHNDDGSHYIDNPGMTLRDYFAGQVIAMLVVHGNGSSVTADAGTAYAVADAMIEARK